MISIHALLAESDLVLLATEIQFENFYPRSPCGERPTFAVTETIEVEFLSTLSLRRATATEKAGPASCAKFLSTLSLRRATRRLCGWIGCFQNFYPRSPCGERLSFRRNNNTGCIFLSTLSLRRATLFFFILQRLNSYFYPRSPCGERLEV